MVNMEATTAVDTAVDIAVAAAVAVAMEEDAVDVLS